MSLLNKLKDGLTKVKESWSNEIISLFRSGSAIDEEFWGGLEEALIAGDAGLDVSEKLVEELKILSKKEKINDKSELNKAFIKLLTDKFTSIKGMGEPFNFDGKSAPYVILLVGVNGSGKTTSAAKLARQFSDQGKSVIFAAADTFRAAAIEQLKTWGERTGIRVIAQQQGSDPAAVVFDAVKAARSSGTDVLIVDTAGRLQSKHNLMEELGKTYRVLDREIGAASVEVVLVLDSVMGQNGFAQAEIFGQSAPISSIILSKYDNTAKGGIVIAISEKLRIPVRYIGIGEKIEDLSPFDPEAFIKALIGDDNNE
ncbi:MAG: signal recognition particle-docking protein FtsY [Synergistaceae bacterium]|nr:signal recognition particle-docking protein FtsY [Synergistaceae bacterium]